MRPPPGSRADRPVDAGRSADMPVTCLR